MRNRWLGNHLNLCTIPFNSATDDDIPGNIFYDAIINLAMPGTAESAGDPEGSLTQSCRISSLLDRMAQRNRFRRLIHFSTFHVYGGPARSFYSEEDETCGYNSYARNHLSCEKGLLETSRIRELFVLRPTNIVAAPAHPGLGQQSGLIFLDLCRQAARTRSIVLRNDGLSYRDFVPFTDALSAIRLLLSIPLTGHRIMNLSAGNSQPLSIAVERIRVLAQEVLGYTPKAVFGSSSDAWRLPFTVSNRSLIDAGWSPEGDLTPEITRILTFFAEHQ
jgi:nucleoside-diphosphate-sugar epimerase